MVRANVEYAQRFRKMAEMQMTEPQIQQEINSIRESCESWAGKRTGPKVMTEKEIRGLLANYLMNRNSYQMTPINYT